MSRYTLNPQGLTFEEWVCASGDAIVDQGRIQPYTWSCVGYAPNPKAPFPGSGGGRGL